MQKRTAPQTSVCFSMQRRCLKIITYCAVRYRYHLRESLVSLKNRVASRASFLMVAGDQIGRDALFTSVKHL